MKKILIILCGFLLVGCNNKLWEVTVDSTKFKNEYEALNKTENSSGNLYLDINISESNPIKYLTYEETIEFIKSGDGILLFSRPGCPYCRGTINATFEFAKKNNIKTINYYNPEKIRELNNDEYKELLRLLDQYLLTDLVTQKENDENFDPNLKRLVVPDLFFINNGRVVSNYNETRAEYKENINQKQKEDFINKLQIRYDEYITSKGQCTSEC